jgi:hypothetical protein
MHTSTRPSVTPPALDVKVVFVTPEMAEAWLHNNTMNRGMSEHVVSKYEAALLNGAWTPDGASIQFAPDGTLLDGQQRLEAIKRTGRSLHMVVVRGVPKESFVNIDTGKSRTQGDMLSASGEKNFNVLAGALRRVYLIESRIRWSGADVTPAMIRATLSAHAEIRQFVSSPPRLKKLLPTSVGVALRYLTWRRDPSLSAWFFERLADGINLTRDDPVLLLKDRLSANRGHTRLTQEFCAVITIKAWNATRTGRPLQVLKWVDSESFPTVA